MAMRPLVIGLAGCLAASSLARATEAPRVRKEELDRCDALVGKKRFVEAERCVATLERDASTPERRAILYTRLTALILREELMRAQTLVDEHLAKAKGEPDGWECWLHNAANWVAWGRGDLPAAIRYTEGMKESLGRHRVSREEARAVILHYLWDRAYLLLDQALASAGDRAPLLATAEQARQAYHQAADPKEDADGLAVLDAYFALRLGRGAEALRLVEQVERGPNGDLQDQYIVALALEAGGDRKAADAVRKVIAGSKNIYPMKALIVRQLERDRRHSPIGRAAPTK